MEKNLYIGISYVQITDERDADGERKRYGMGSDEVTESRFTSPSEAYHFCLKEFGRCSGKVYVDGDDGKAKHIGWVFIKRVKYDDSPEFFTREAWVSLHTAQPTITKKNHYLTIS